MYILFAKNCWFTVTAWDTYGVWTCAYTVGTVFDNAEHLMPMMPLGLQPSKKIEYEDSLRINRKTRNSLKSSSDSPLENNFPRLVSCSSSNDLEDVGYCSSFNERLTNTGMGFTMQSMKTRLFDIFL